MDYRDIDDITLLDHIAHSRGDSSAALSELYDRYSRLVYSLAIQMVGDSAVAEEIIQDVFVRVWEKASTYRAAQAKVSTWLSSITRHRSIDELRKRGVRPERDSVSWEVISPDNLARVDGTEKVAEQALQRQRVREAIASLPPEQREALALAYLRGLTHSEIAEWLDQPLGTVKTRIRLGMQKLRESLRDEANDR